MQVLNGIMEKHCCDDVLKAKCLKEQELPKDRKANIKISNGEVKHFFSYIWYILLSMNY